jgi:hypothetical protein
MPARRVDHLIERPVVVLVDLVGISDIEPDGIEVGGFVTLVEIRREVAMRHQVEHADLHGITSPC